MCMKWHWKSWERKERIPTCRWRTSCLLSTHLEWVLDSLLELVRVHTLYILPVCSRLPYHTIHLALSTGVTMIFSRFDISQFRSIAWFNTATGLAFVVLQLVMFHGESGCRKPPQLGQRVYDMCKPQQATMIWINVLVSFHGAFPTSKIITSVTRNFPLVYICYATKIHNIIANT